MYTKRVLVVIQLLIWFWCAFALSQSEPKKQGFELEKEPIAKVGSQVVDLNLFNSYLSDLHLTKNSYFTKQFLSKMMIDSHLLDSFWKEEQKPMVSKDELDSVLQVFQTKYPSLPIKVNGAVDYNRFALDLLEEQYAFVKLFKLKMHRITDEEVIQYLSNHPRYKNQKLTSELKDSAISILQKRRLRNVLRTAYRKLKEDNEVENYLIERHKPSLLSMNRAIVNPDTISTSDHSVVVSAKSASNNIFELFL